MVRSRKKKSGLRDTLEAIGAALILALIIRTFMVQAFKIPSGSMLETLQIGDHLLVNKISYGTPVDIPFTGKMLFHVPGFGGPGHGDILVFKFPQDPKRDFIKRVIGTGGDRIEIRDKVVHRNGVALEEPYVRHSDKNVLPAAISQRDNVPEFAVPEGKLFMMGDNRDQSLDSRFWGFVDESQVRGKAFVLYWSWNGKAPWGGQNILTDWNGGKVRWGRIGSLIR